jgi:hypothetical protein
MAMINFDALGKILSFLPGGAVGGLLGGLLGLFGFASVTTQCQTGTFEGPFGPVPMTLACVETPFGIFYSVGGFAVMTTAVGAVVGIISNVVYRALTKPSP